MEEEQDRELREYLARIRKTIADSESLVSQAQLRIAETDRLLESQGLTREQVMAMRFTDAQFEAANAELARRGLDPLERWAVVGDGPDAREAGDEAREIAERRGSGDPPPSDAELENRQRKFGMMMKPFQL